MDLWALLISIANILLVLAASVWIAARRKPAEAIAWILVIVFIPVVGIVVFLLIGQGRLPRRRREQQAEVNARIAARDDVKRFTTPAGTGPEWLDSAATLNRALGALPMVAGNTAELHDDYEETIRAIAADVDAATRFVHVEFYILVRDDTTTVLFDAMARAAARGVDVRVLSDHLSGFMYPHRRETQAAMANAGVQWRAMLPLRPFSGQWQRIDLRNHRKLVVVDGEIGWTGSLNMIDSTYLKPKNIKRGLHWKELMVRVTGPAVGEIDAVFVTDWYAEADELLPVVPPAPAPGGTLDAQIVPSGPSFENDNNLKLFVLMLHSAKRRISITSPYFVPEESTQLAIVTAASRGVAVELFVSEIGDQALVYHAQRSYYEELLRAGVRIHLYRSPTVLHSKHFSIDDDVAVIGSSNMDIRSFRLNMEVSMLVHGRDFVDRLRVVEDSYRANSREIDLESWLRRPLGQKTRDALARLTSSLQ